MTSCSCGPPFRLCSAHWVWRFRLRPPTPDLVCAPPMYITRAWTRRVLPVFLINAPTACPPPPQSFDPVYAPCGFAWPCPRRLGSFARGVLALCRLLSRISSAFAYSSSAVRLRHCRLWVAFPAVPRFGLWRGLALIRYDILHVLRCAFACFQATDGPIGSSWPCSSMQPA
jgi:hypothetical protein